MIDLYNREITYLRISVTDRCNLRCKYCMPEEGVRKLLHEDILTYEEITEITEAAAQLGISKVRITGGEPLLRPGVTNLCRRVAALPGIGEICVTTNGVLLEELAAELHDAGVHRVNISLDTLDAKKYKEITRLGDIESVFRGISAARKAGMRVKINTVLIGGFNDNEITLFADMTKENEIDVRFIELMPMETCRSFDRSAYLSGDKVLQALPQLVPDAEDNGLARLYRLPGGLGRVGIITPLSRHFCGACNRLRLTAEGKLKPCLHSKEEIGVRGLHGDELKKAIKRAVFLKPKMHGVLSPEHASEAGREMHTIGG